MITIKRIMKTLKFFLVIIQMSFVLFSVAEAQQAQILKKRKATKVMAPNSAEWRMSFLSRGFINEIITQQAYGAGLSESVSMRGANFGVTLGLERDFFNDYALAVNLGYQTLKATGTAVNNVCGGTTTKQCQFNVNYVTASGLAKINYKYTDVVFWFALGAVIKSPISKASNSINEKDLVYAQSALIDVGLDYKVSKEFFIPVSLEYEYSLNTSSTVPTISQYGLQVGIGYIF